MAENTTALGPREQQIAALLLEGYSNTEIAQRLKMKQRTVKAHFNRLFRRFGIKDGIKRVKLATLLYRRELHSKSAPNQERLSLVMNNESSNALLKDSEKVKWQEPSPPVVNKQYHSLTGL
jgi:Bacterial regulatory proteins, luxR family